MCYGLQKVPEEDWVCVLCETFGSRGRMLRCPLCTCRGGVMRPSNLTSNSSFFQKRNDSYCEFMNLNHPKADKNRDTKIRIPFSVTNGNGDCSPQDNGQNSTTISLNEQKETKSPNQFNNDIPSASNMDLLTLGFTEENGDSTFKGHQTPDNDTKNHCQLENEDDFDEEEQTVENKGFRRLKKNKKNKQQKNGAKRKESQKSQTSQRKKSHCNNDEIPLLYDYHQETFKFSPEELKDEPIPKTTWLHLSCTYWMPETHIKDQFGTFEIVGVNTIEKERFKLECLICGQRNGACITCSHIDCPQSFHVECARRARLHFENQTTTHTKFLLYCPTHTPLQFKTALNLQDKKAKEEILKFYRYFKKYFKSRKIEPEGEILAIEEEDENFPTASKEKRQKKEKLRGKKEALKEKMEYKRKMKREDYIKYLARGSKIILAAVKEGLGNSENYMFKIDLKKIDEKNDSFSVSNVSVPPNKLFYAKILKSDPAFVEAGSRLQMHPKEVHSKYSKAIALLKSYEKNQSIFHVTDGTVPQQNAYQTVNSNTEPTGFDEEHMDERGLLIRRRRGSRQQALLCMSKAMEWRANDR